MTTPETNDTDAISVEQGPARDVFTFSRSERLFATRRNLAEQLEKDRTAVPLVADQLFHPEVPCDGVVRLGSLRVTRFLPDNREVTLAVLQAGNTFVTRVVTAADQPRSDSLSPDLYNLADVVLMALGDTELWILPAEALADDA